MRSFILLLFLALFIPQTTVFSQNYADSLTQKLHTLWEQSDLPGFGVALVAKEEVLYMAGFGYANKETKQTYEVNTIHNIGSVTKTLLGISLLKLEEEGKLKLDDPINQYLPFEVTHPRFPDVPITLRMLATHSGGLTDGRKDMVIEHSYLFDGNIDFSKSELPKDYYPYFRIYKENQSISMESFLKNAYSKEGEWYHKKNFTKVAPGTNYHYTNLGATLLGYIIEQVSGMPYWAFTKKHIIEPLGMEETFWSYQEVPKDRLAEPYLSNGLHIPHYSLITYPDGGLHSCVSDFTKYLMEMIRGANGEGNLLSAASYQKLFSNQLVAENFPNGEFEKSYGLNWNVNKSGDNVGADGADPGIGTYMLFTTKGNIGLIIFKNSSSDGLGSEAMLKIRSLLFQHTSKLMKKEE